MQFPTSELGAPCSHVTKFYLKMTLSAPILTNTVDTLGPGVFSYV